MKITEILVESQQLDEGPLLNKIGAGIGKAAGTVAKGIGAVAGGVVGAGKALAKGYQAGKSTVGGAGDDAETDPTADPAATTKPAAAPGGAPAADPAAGGTQYAQVKANIDKLDKKGKQRILQLLQKQVGSAPAATTKPAAGGGAPAADPGAGAMGAMAGQLAKGGAAPNTMANAQVSKTNTAKPGNPNAAPAAGNKKNLGFGFNTDTGQAFSSAEERTAAGEAGEMAAREFPASPAAAPATTTKKTGGRVKGQLSQDPRAVKRREANAAKQDRKSVV